LTNPHYPLRFGETRYEKALPNIIIDKKYEEFTLLPDRVRGQSGMPNSSARNDL
jgi:hypothetical protein